MRSASPLRIVLMLACAALGAVLTNVEWLHTPPSSANSNCNNRHDDNQLHRDGGAADAVAATGRPPASRIHYRLVRGRPYEQKYGFKYACDPSQPGTRPLPDDMKLPGIVDFVTDISTSLKIAVVGDSIGVQIGHRLEESMQPRPDDDDEKGEFGSYNRVAYVETDWDNLVASFPVWGGGALISYRVNGLLWDEMQTSRRVRRRRRSRNLQSYFKPQRFNRTAVDVALGRPTIPLKNVDVVVQRITYPWIPLEKITTESLERNTALASDMFGMETLVYVNMYFTNNVLDGGAHRRLLERQQLVRDFARTHVPASNSALKKVLLLDLDRLVDLFNERNARSIGLDTASQPFEQWMLSQTLGPYNPRAVFRKHIGQVCGALVANHTDACDHNMFFVDGLHFCPSTFAGRVTAGIACLVECAELDRNNYDDDEKDDGKPLASDSFLRTCERKCNDRYMSLDPIPVSDMVQWNATNH